MFLLKMYRRSGKHFLNSLFTVSCFLFLALLTSACSQPAAKKPATEETTEDTVDEKSAAVQVMPAFKSVDLEGNEIDNSIFANADITVLNFWGTYCGPCINEMPELEAWNKELPDNIQIIGVVIDVFSAVAPEYETARELVKDTGVSYTNLIVGDQFHDVMQNLTGVPTTFFVDSSGKCIHEEFLGASVEDYKRIVESLQ